MEGLSKEESRYVIGIIIYEAFLSFSVASSADLD